MGPWGVHSPRAPARAHARAGALVPPREGASLGRFAAEEGGGSDESGGRGRTRGR